MQEELDFVWDWRPRPPPGAGVLDILEGSKLTDRANRVRLDTVENVENYLKAHPGKFNGLASVYLTEVDRADQNWQYGKITAKHFQSAKDVRTPANIKAYLSDFYDALSGAIERTRRRWETQKGAPIGSKGDFIARVIAANYFTVDVFLADDVTDESMLVLKVDLSGLDSVPTTEPSLDNLIAGLTWRGDRVAATWNKVELTIRPTLVKHVYAADITKHGEMWTATLDECYHEIDSDDIPADDMRALTEKLETDRAMSVLWRRAIGPGGVDVHMQLRAALMCSYTHGGSVWKMPPPGPSFTTNDRVTVTKTHGAITVAKTADADTFVTVSADGPTITVTVSEFNKSTTTDTGVKTKQHNFTRSGLELLNKVAPALQQINLKGGLLDAFDGMPVRTFAVVDLDNNRRTKQVAFDALEVAIGEWGAWAGGALGLETAPADMRFATVGKVKPVDRLQAINPGLAFSMMSWSPYDALELGVSTASVVQAFVKGLEAGKLTFEHILGVVDAYPERASSFSAPGAVDAMISTLQVMESAKLKPLLRALAEKSNPIVSRDPGGDYRICLDEKCNTMMELESRQRPQGVALAYAVISSGAIFDKAVRKGGPTPLKVRTPKRHAPPVAYSPLTQKAQFLEVTQLVPKFLVDGYNERVRGENVKPMIFNPAPGAVAVPDGGFSVALAAAFCCNAKSGVDHRQFLDDRPARRWINLFGVMGGGVHLPVVVFDEPIPFASARNFIEEVAEAGGENILGGLIITRGHVVAFTNSNGRIVTCNTWGEEYGFTDDGKIGRKGMVLRVCFLHLPDRTSPPPPFPASQSSDSELLAIIDGSNVVDRKGTVRYDTVVSVGKYLYEHPNLRRGTVQVGVGEAIVDMDMDTRTKFASAYFTDVDDLRTLSNIKDFLFDYYAVTTVRRSKTIEEFFFDVLDKGYIEFIVERPDGNTLNLRVDVPSYDDFTSDDESSGGESSGGESSGDEDESSLEPHLAVDQLEHDGILKILEDNLDQFDGEVRDLRGGEGMMLQAGGKCWFAAVMTLMARCGQTLETECQIDRALLVYATTMYNCSYQIDRAVAADDVHVSNVLGPIKGRPAMPLLLEDPPSTTSAAFVDLAVV